MGRLGASRDPRYEYPDILVTTLGHLGDSAIPNAAHFLVTHDHTTQLVSLNSTFLHTLKMLDQHERYKCFASKFKEIRFAIADICV